MSVKSRKSWIARIIVAAVVVVTGAFGEASAVAGGPNRIDAVDFIDGTSVTQVRIRGTQAAKFSVYKLERPTRVVVDVAQAELTDAVTGGHERSATLTPNTWAVSQIAAQELEDGGSVVRVVVTLARPGRYDVKAIGTDVVVTVTARDDAPKVAGAAELASARADADEARRDRAGAIAAKDAAEAAARTAKRKAEQAEAAAERLRAQAAADAARAERAERAAAEASSQGDAARKRVEAELASARADAARANAAAQAAKAEAERARRASTTADEQAAAKAKALVAAAEADRQAAAVSRAQADDLKKQAQRAQAEAEQRATAAKRAQADAEQRATAAKQAQADAERARREAEQAKAEAAAAARTATAARDKATTDGARDRAALETAAAQAEARLAAATAATAKAERQRAAAEAAAQAAQRDAAAARQAADAEARRRAEAESGRAVAETAAAKATATRKQEEQAARAAAAERAAAERAAATAKAEADRATAELASRTAAERRAAELASARASAAQTAKAEADAAVQRQASKREIDAARAEATRLDDERRKADAALAARRQEVAAQQAEVAKLAAARTAAATEVARLEEQTARARAAREEEERRLTEASARRGAAETAARAAEARAEAAKAAQAETAARAAKAAAAAPALVAIRDVGFTGDADGGTVALDVGSAAKIDVLSATDTRVEFVVDGAELPSALERKLDVTRFGSPVRAVSSYRDRDQAGRVRIVVDLASPAAPKVSRQGDAVRVSFAGSGRRPARTQDVPPPVVGGYGASSTAVAQTSVAQVSPTRRKVFRGNVVNFDFKEAPLHDLLRAIAEVAKINIVVPEDLNANVTVRLNRVPWDQALEVILASKGMWYRREGNLYRIAKREQIDAEDEKEAARREAMRKSEEPEPEIVILNYASAQELKNKLEPMLSEKGRIEVDARTNSVIVNDIAGVRRRVKDLAQRLDTQTPQISIEARIVEARSTFQRSFGIQWGGNANASAAGGNATGLIFPSSVAFTGGADDAQLNATGVATPSNFAVNLPVAAANALGMSLGSVGGNFNINLRLSAAEDTGSVRIISAPKITVLNNAQATISQGVAIPISVVGASGTQTQFVNADLSLSVTPYVSQSDCSIAMDVNVSKNEADFVNTGARGDPTILRKEASTKMLVADGETAVLGGIYTRNSGLSYSKVPFLGDLPVLGWLFKNRLENDERTEVLVFITPKITNKANLRCQ